MDFLNPLFLLLGICGLTFLLLGLLMYKNPPKEINHLYGYRTRQSMSSQEKWDFAQVFAGKLMYKGGSFFITLGVIAALLNLSEALNIIIGLGTLLLFCVYLIYKTEKQLKLKFKDNETLQRDTKI
jgi:uncharacterized membrane protein